MQIIQEKPLRSTRESLNFFKEHYSKLGEIKYIVLYYAEGEWLINRELFHQYTIVIGTRAQIWMSGLTWGYYGTGPYGLYELMRLIDSNITYEQIVSLEWMAENPIMFERFRTQEPMIVAVAIYLSNPKLIYKDIMELMKKTLNYHVNHTTLSKCLKKVRMNHKSLKYE